MYYVRSYLLVVGFVHLPNVLSFAIVYQPPYGYER